MSDGIEIASPLKIVRASAPPLRGAKPALGDRSPQSYNASLSAYSGANRRGIGSDLI